MRKTPSRLTVAPEVRRRLVAAAGSLAALVLVAACTPASSSVPSGAPVGQAPAFYARTAAQAAPGAPNIVFVLTDDLSDNLVSNMPAVLSMERRGTSFTHYYVVDSLCCPSRTAIFTSEYPHDDGVFTNGGKRGGYPGFQAHHDARHCFVRDLKKAGYTTAFMGKYLNGYRAYDPVPPGWDVWDGVDRGGYEEYNYNVNTNGVALHFGDSPADYLTETLSQKAGDFITSAAAQPHPFFLEVASFAPHAPYVPSLKYADAAAGALYPETPAYDAQVRNPPPWLHHRRPLTQVQEQRMLGHYRQRIEDDDSIDDLLTNIEAKLQAAGVADNTDIVFSSDNGYHMGEYRLLSGKQTAFDTDINVPLVIVGPHIAAGRQVSAMASSIDLGPTFDGLAHAPVDPKVDGVSLLPLLDGHVPADWQRGVLIEHHGHDDNPLDPDRQTAAQADPPSYEAIRTLGGLFVRYRGGAQEYYDTRNDPYELDNLGGKHAPEAMKVALSELEHCHRAAACQAAATLPFGGHDVAKRLHRHKHRHRSLSRL